MAAYQAPLSLGFSRQEYWSGLPFPSPMHESEKWKWSRSVVSNSWRPHGLQLTRLLHPLDFPGKSTGVGCHCLLWYRKLLTINCEDDDIKRNIILRWKRGWTFVSSSLKWGIALVAQSCPTLRDPVDWNPSGSSVHGIFQAGVLEWGATAFSRAFVITPQIQRPVN